jgi:hypothetical protein
MVGNVEFNGNNKKYQVRSKILLLLTRKQKDAFARKKWLSRNDVLPIFVRTDKTTVLITGKNLSAWTDGRPTGERRSSVRRDDRQNVRNGEG